MVSVNLFNSLLEAIIILYVTGELGIGPGLDGLAFASGSIGFLVGALLPGWVTRRFGVGAAIIGGLLLASFSDLLIPLVDPSAATAMIMMVLVASQFFFSLGLVIFNTTWVSLAQAITPNHLRGRMTATIGFVAGAAVPLGGLLGGALGETLGLRPALLIAALGEVLAVLWLVLSPVRSQRDQPAFTE